MAVVIESESKGLGESAGAAGDRFAGGVEGQPSKRSHAGQPLEGFGRSKQDRGGASRDAADDVDAGVNSVASIGVEPSRWTEHGLVAWGRAGMGMGRGIAAIAEIGLDLDQSNHHAFSGFEASNQPATDQFGRDDAAIARIEGLAKGLAEGGHGRSIGKSAVSAPSKTRQSEPTLECRAGMADALYAPRVAQRTPRRPFLCGDDRSRKGRRPR